MKSVVTDAGDGTGSVSLESFVMQLQRDGVAAGQREAERLVAAARQESEEMLRRARHEAESLAEQVRAAAARDHQRSLAELELAARDTVLRLEHAVEQALETLLHRSVNGQLRKAELLEKLLLELVGAYARAEAAGRITAIRLPHSHARQLEDWSMALLAAGVRDDAEVRAVLRHAGFEYRLTDGATVEVTAASIVAQLMDLVRPGLREVIARAVPEADEGHD